VFTDPFPSNRRPIFARVSSHGIVLTESFSSNESVRHNVNVAADLSRVEAGSNNSTVTLRVVGGDEKGSLESETVKIGSEFHGTRTRE
jgi:hypothetical protein